MIILIHVHGIKARYKEETLMLNVKGNQVIKQRDRDSKTYKKAKIEAYYVKEMKEQKQKT